jgi:hypothetical protein
MPVSERILPHRHPQREDAHVAARTSHHGRSTGTRGAGGLPVRPRPVGLRSRGTGQGPGPRPHGLAGRRAEDRAQYDARRPQRHAPAAVRGQGPGQGPERPDRVDRRHGVRPVQRLRRPRPHADGREAGEERAALQQVPHDRAVFADPGRPVDGPQPSHVQHGLDHRDRDRLPRPDRAAAEQRRPARRDAPAQRLQHGRVRQVARNGGLGSEPVRPDRPVADPVRVRQVLRVHRRRNEPVGPGRLRGHEPGRAAEGPELPLHDGHDEPGHQVDQRPEVPDAGQAVLHLLRPRGHARPAPRPEGAPGTRASSTRAGTRSARRRWPARSRSALSPPGPSSPPSRRPSRTGTS